MLLCAFIVGHAETQEVVKIYKPTQRVSELKTDGTKYMIFNTTKLQGNRYGFVYNNGSGLGKPVSTPTGFEALTNAYLFTLEASATEGAYYIKSVSNGKYVNYQGNTNNETGQDCYIYKFLDSPYKNTDANGQYMSKENDATFIPYADLTEDQCLFTIGQKNAGDYCAWNGNEGTFATWSTAHPYAFYEVEEVEEIVTTTAITELANVSNNKLYIIKNARTANTALVYKNGGANVVWNGKETSVIYDPRSDNFRWAIYKSSNSKYYLYNIGAGKYIGSAITKDAAIPFVDASGLHSVVIEKASGDANYPFVMSTNNKKGALNTNGSLQQGVVNWRDGYGHMTDAGNQFAFYEVADIPNDVLTAIETAVTDYEANGVANWKNSHGARGYVGHYPLSTQDAYNAIASEVDIDNFMYTNNNVVAFATGKYYRLVCVAPKTEKGDASYNTLTFNGASHLVTAPLNVADPNQIFVFETNGSNYKLKSLNANAYLNKISAGGYRSQVVTSAEDIAEIELRNVACAQYELQSKQANGWCLFAENNATEAVPYACSGWSDGKDSPSAWNLIPATELEVEVANAYGSIYLPFDVTLADGQKAYAVTATSATSATLTEKEDIPAGEGAILAQGSYVLKLADATSDWTDNKLEGSNVNTYFAGPAYVLGKDGVEVGLFKAALNKDADGNVGTTHFLNNANKAYLPVEEGASLVLRFNFGGETTAIESVLNNGVDANAPIYDLSGRRVNSAVKGGIYIQNGKKFIVK